VLCTNLFWSVFYTPYTWNNMWEPGDTKLGWWNNAFPIMVDDVAGKNAQLTYHNQTEWDLMTAGDFFYSPGKNNWGDMINRHANFFNFGMAMLTLARCVTGESFNGIMHDTMDEHWADNALRCCYTCGPIVDGVAQSSCGASVSSVFLQMSFTMIAAAIILSLIIGVILDNFANIGSEQKAITMEQLEEFREVWIKYDPKGTFVVPAHSLLAILQQLNAPMGIAGRQPALTRAQMLQFLGELDVPDHGGYIHFFEALTAISNRIAGVALPLNETTRKLAKTGAKLPGLGKLDKPAHNALTNYLVSLLQSRWRGYEMRRKYTEDGTAVVQTQKPADAAGTTKAPRPNQVAPA